MNLEALWHIVLTVCLDGSCLQQDVQWFDTKEQCRTTLVEYQAIPKDGDWDSVEWTCKPLYGEEA